VVEKSNQLSRTFKTRKITDFVYTISPEKGGGRHKVFGTSNFGGAGGKGNRKGRRNETPGYVPFLWLQDGLGGHGALERNAPGGRRDISGGH